MDLLKQLRELVAGVDLSDEEREVLDALFTELEAQDTAQRSQIAEFEAAQAEASAGKDSDEDTDEARASAAPEIVLDMAPVAEKLGEFAEPIVTALRELNAKIDAIVETATEDVDEDSAAADSDDHSVDGDEGATETRLKGIEKTLKALHDALPVRRGVVGDAEADQDDEEDATSRELNERLKDVTDPKIRLRETIGAYSD